MGRYITHEQLPFKGKLVKIRLRNYGFNSIVNQSENEDELLEITPDGTVKLSVTYIDGPKNARFRYRSMMLNTSSMRLSPCFPSTGKKKSRPVPDSGKFGC